MFPRTLLCLALSSVCLPAMADTVWLNNGDRLSGKIKLFDGGKLLIQTEYAGAVAIDWTQVKTLESDQELLVKQDAYVGEKAKSLQAAGVGTVVLANGDAPKAVELASIQQILKPRPVVEDLVWRGNVDVALDYERAEKDTDDYDLDFKTSARHGKWRHTAEGEYNREFQDGDVTSDNWRAQYSLDRFITEQWFWQGRLNYRRDKVEELSRQRTVGSGPGYQFWDDELGAFSLGSLLNRTDYEYEDGGKDNFYSLAMKWDYNRYLIGKSVEFFTSGEVGKPLSDVADFALDAEMGLRYRVTDWASLNLKAERDIITGSQNADFSKTRYTAGFGVTW
ncbi:Protein of unknown function, DUF481 [Pseudomonas sp. ok272]|uniref:DUF481 domain-containing protein n=1 Tax=unclassified Pseudomonas TaxID=196821 RepID=UPI0008AEAFE9|nr:MULTISPECIES: DUF481 domain-containing protein [unclassified Pseudomonas]SEM35623.1 Protein of unknown function, DUF481 [Pseudomonas sp. ok272]SFM35836.1 Protein of unknown function, DUF481 [Pseudomonas sp. ok602]